jgi:hypothetical protein
MTIALVMSWLGVSSIASAGPILDWMFPGMAARREARRAAWSAPGTTTYHIPVSAYYGSYPAWNATGQAYANTSLMPTTAYRTVWSPVPVTTYSPVTYVNPLAPGTVNDMQACTGYSWEARRVPYISYSPGASYTPTYNGTTSYYGGGAYAPAAWGTPQAVTTNYGSAVSYSAPVVTPMATTGAYAPTTSIAPATYYEGTTGSYPAAPSCSGCGYATGEAFAPTTAPQGAYTLPSAPPTVPSYDYGNGDTTGTYSSPPSGGVPADQQPSLITPGTSPQIESPPGAGAQYVPPSNAMGSRMVPVPRQASQQAGLVQRQSPQPLALTAPLNGVMTTAIPQSEPQRGAVQENYLRPIPELDTDRRPWEPNLAPQAIPDLRSNEDRTASRPQTAQVPQVGAWEAVPIRWAVMSPERDRETRVQQIGTAVSTSNQGHAPASANSPAVGSAEGWESDVWRPVSR